MPRSIDEPIPPDEKLFRSVAPDEVQGDCVLPEAVEVPACSYSRSKYGPPEAALSPDTRPRETGIAFLTPAMLPPPIERLDGAPFEFFAADAPEEGDTHAEVRLKRVDAAYNPKRSSVPKPIRVRAVAALADCMRVCRTPT